jgi:hypothetical protein
MVWVPDDCAVTTLRSVRASGGVTGKKVPRRHGEPSRTVVRYFDTLTPAPRRFHGPRMLQQLTLYLQKRTFGCSAISDVMGQERRFALQKNNELFRVSDEPP